MHSIKVVAAIAAACSSLFAAQSDAAPQFVNGVVIPGNTLDATGQPGANRGRVGFFSDLYYDPEREEWWALSDRGPGGGVIDYATRVQRLAIKLNKTTGAIKKVAIEKTITFTDPWGILASPVNPGVTEPRALNGLNPLEVNGDVGVLGRSFDPEASSSIRAPGI